MEQGSVFYNNKTQAIRLPKSMRLPEGTKRVTVERQGDSLIITPKDEQFDWDAWFDGERLPSDFLLDREQGEFEEREPFE